jgi:hypothetical protein
VNSITLNNCKIDIHNVVLNIGMNSHTDVNNALGAGAKINKTIDR